MYSTRQFEPKLFQLYSIEEISWDVSMRSKKKTKEIQKIKFEKLFLQLYFQFHHRIRRYPRKTYNHSTNFNHTTFKWAHHSSSLQFKRNQWWSHSWEQRRWDNYWSNYEVLTSNLLNNEIKNPFARLGRPFFVFFLLTSPDVIVSSKWKESNSSVSIGPRIERRREN